LISITLVTGNKRKLAEVAAIMEPYGIKVTTAKAVKFEAQGEIDFVSSLAARLASMELLAPVVVDDSGLYVDSLNGFPGPYSSYAFDKLGNEGLLKLMDGISDRKAVFRCIVTYADVMNGEIESFEGQITGYIRSEIGKEGGFGFDPIFSPFGPSGKAFSEMDASQKNEISHRGIAFRKLAAFLLNKIAQG